MFYFLFYIIGLVTGLLVAYGVLFLYLTYKHEIIRVMDARLPKKTGEVIDYDEQQDKRDEKLSTITEDLTIEQLLG